MLRVSTQLIMLACIILTAIGTVRSQFDPTFGSSGIVTTHIGDSDRPIASLLLSDQKILVLSENFSLPARFHLIRYNSDGTPDNTYGTGGRLDLAALLGPGGFGFTGAVLQSDGKIVISGGDNGMGLVVRLNENGTLDTSFNGSGMRRSDVTAGGETLESVAVQPDGKILVAGTSGTPDFRLILIRYNSNGTFDSTFGTNSQGFITHDSSTPRTLILQSTGKFIVSQAANFVGAGSILVRRFNSNGTQDLTFSAFLEDYRFRALIVLPDDKLLAASEGTGFGPNGSGLHADVRLSRYTADGAVDMTFGTNGQTTFDITTSRFDDLPNGLLSTPDGQIIVSATSNILQNRTQTSGQILSVAKLTSNGTLAGRTLQVSCFASDRAFLHVYPDGRVLTTYRTAGQSTGDLLLIRMTGIPLRSYRFRAVPFNIIANSPFGLPGGTSDPTLFRSSNSRWFAYPFPQSEPLGLPGDLLMAGDFRGDIAAERAAFRPSQGRWYIGNGGFQTNESQSLKVDWGLNGDVPIVGDFDGDLKADVTVFRPSNGFWYILGTSGPPAYIHWGTTGDKPVAGDYDGDFIDDVAVWRPSDGNWYIIKSSDGQALITHFGLQGDIPVQDDYDADGKTDVAVWRPSTGIWYRLNSSDGAFSAIQWGIPTDKAVPGDYDGDSKADAAVFRPADKLWYILNSSNGTVSILTWGIDGDIPVQALGTDFFTFPN